MREVKRESARVEGGAGGGLGAGSAVGGRARVVFAGNPNCGKTTLFNRLTGMRAKTSNFPGTTVELRRAERREAGVWVEYVDLPGMYGWSGSSPEERMAAGFVEAVGSDPGTLVVVVVDVTHLERNLYLVGQVRDRVSQVVVVLNMLDLAGKVGLDLDLDLLSRELGAPVVALSARTGLGIPALQDLLGQWAEGKLPTAAPPLARCDLCTGCPHRARFQWAEGVCGRVARWRPGYGEPRRWGDRVDRWVTHPVSGLAAFFLSMLLVFQALFWLAQGPMEWIDGAFVVLRGWVRGALGAGWWSEFLGDGLLTGVGAALMFLPQICILFFLLSLLEDTGYLARAAFVADRWMRRVGLPGKAFLPMVSAHACAIPAVMSARAIENPRDRLATILVLPFFTCSARLPVYAMVTAMLVPGSPWVAGMILAGAYFMGMGAAFMTARLIKGTLLRGPSSPLIIELPGYKLPSLRTALLTALDRGGIFLRKAGTLIAALMVVLWALARYPSLPEGESGRPVEALSAATQVEEGEGEAEFARRQLEQSVVGRVGRALQPVFAPLGFDWQITVGVLTSFAAREVIVSTLSVLYGLGEEGGDEPEGMAERLRGNLHPAVGLSLLVFFILAMQCLPTQAVTRRETGSWRWPLLQWVYMSGLAYSAAFVTYQVGIRLLVGPS